MSERPRRSAAVAAEKKTKEMLVRDGKIIVEKLGKLLVGVSIEKEFPCFGVFSGIVERVTLRDKRRVWIHVKYPSDGDEEDLNAKEFIKCCKDENVLKTFFEILPEEEDDDDDDGNISDASDEVDSDNNSASFRKRKRKKNHRPRYRKSREDSDDSDSDGDIFLDEDTTTDDESQTEEASTRPYFRTPRKCQNVHMREMPNGSTRSEIRTPLPRETFTFTRDPKYIRCKKAKGRMDLPVPEKRSSLDPSSLGDAVMLWTAIHTFNSNPRIGNKESKGLFPVIRITAFTLSSFLDALQWRTHNVEGAGENAEKNESWGAASSAAMPNLLSEIHMALLYPLLQGHLSRQVNDLRSTQTNPDWLVESARYGIEMQDMLLCIDRIRWQAIVVVLLDQYAAGDDRDLIVPLKTTEYHALDVFTRLRVLEWLIGQILNLPHVASAISTSFKYVRSVQLQARRNASKSRSKYSYVKGRTVNDDEKELELAQRFKKFPPAATDKNHNKFWLSSQFDSCVHHSAGGNAPMCDDETPAVVYAEDGLTGRWYAYSTRSDLKLLRGFVQKHGKKRNRRKGQWWECRPSGLNEVVEFIDNAVAERDVCSGSDDDDDDEEEEEEEDDDDDDDDENNGKSNRKSNPMLSASADAALIAAKAASFAKSLHCEKFGTIAVEAIVPLLQDPKTPMLIVYENVEYKVNLRPEMVPGTKVVTKIFRVPSSRDRKCETPSTDPAKETLAHYVNLGVKRQSPPWHENRYSHIWTAEDSSKCGPLLCVAKEMLWIEDSLMHVLRFTIESVPAWTSDAWRRDVEAHTVGRELDTSSKHIHGLRECLRRLESALRQRCAFLPSHHNTVFLNAFKEKTDTFGSFCINPWWLQSIRESETLSAFALELGAFANAVHGLRFLDRTSWTHLMPRSESWDDIFIPRRGQNLVYDRSRQVMAEKQMTAKERFLALECNANTLFWRGDVPILCVVDSVQYVSCEGMPFAVVSVRLSHSTVDPVDQVWADEENALLDRVKDRCKSQTRLPLAKLLARVTIALKRKLDTDCFERTPTPSQGPDYAKVVARPNMTLKRIEHNIARGKYANAQEYFNDVVEIAFNFADYWIGERGHAQLAPVPRLLIDTAVLLLRQHADEEVLVEDQVLLENVVITTESSRSSSSGDSVRSPLGRTCEEEEKSYVGQRVRIFRESGICNGRVISRLDDTNDSEDQPLWRVRFDSDGSDIVVDAVQLLRGMRSFRASALLQDRVRAVETRRLDLERRQAEQLRLRLLGEATGDGEGDKSVSNTVSFGDNIRGDDTVLPTSTGCAVEVSATTSKVTADLVAIASNTNIGKHAQNDDKDDSAPRFVHDDEDNDNVEAVFDPSKYVVVSCEGLEVQESDGSWKSATIYREIEASSPEHGKRIVLSFGHGEFEGLEGKPYTLIVVPKSRPFNGSPSYGKLLDGDGDLIVTRFKLSKHSSNATSQTKEGSVADKIERSDFKFVCKTCLKRFKHSSSLYYHTKRKLCTKFGQRELAEFRARIDDLVSDISAKVRDVSSVDVLREIFNEAAASNSVQIRTEALLTQLGDDAMAIGRKDLVVRIRDLLLSEAKCGFVSNVDTSTVSSKDALNTSDRSESMSSNIAINDIKNPTGVELHGKKKLRSARAAALKASTRLKDEWISPSPKQREHVSRSKTNSSRRGRGVRKPPLPRGPGGALRFLVSLSSKCTRFLYPAEMYFAEVREEQESARKREKERIEEERSSFERKCMFDEEVRTRIKILSEIARKRFIDAARPDIAVVPPPLHVPRMLQPFIPDPSRAVVARRIHRWRDPTRIRAMQLEAQIRREERERARQEKQEIRMKHRLELQRKKELLKQLNEQRRRERLERAQRIEIERIKIRVQREEERIAKIVTKCLTSLVKRVDRVVRKSALEELKASKREAKRIARENARLARENEVEERRRKRLMRRVFKEGLHEELLYRRQRLRHPLKLRPENLPWPPRMPNGTRIPLPIVNVAADGSETFEWYDDATGHSDDEDEITLNWERYIWRKLTMVKVPERPRIHAVTAVEGLIFQARSLGISEDDPSIAPLRRLHARSTASLIDGKRFSKRINVRLKLGGELVIAPGQDGLPEFSPPGRCIALIPSRRRKKVRRRRDPSSPMVGTHSSERIRKKRKVFKSCGCGCPDAVESWIQCDDGDGWWCLHHAKISLDTADTLASWSCRVCAKKRKSEWKSLECTGDLLPKENKTDTLRIDTSPCPSCAQTPNASDASTPVLMRWLCCDACDRWFHASCEGVPRIAVVALNQNQSVKWHCGSCRSDSGAFFYASNGRRVRVRVKIAGRTMLKKQNRVAEYSPLPLIFSNGRRSRARVRFDGKIL